MCIRDRHGYVFGQKSPVESIRVVEINIQKCYRLVLYMFQLLSFDFGTVSMSHSCLLYTSYIWLCHLSKDNNHPELAYKTVEWKLKNKGVIVGKNVQLLACLLYTSRCV